MRSTPMLMVADVPTSVRWYCALLGVENDHHRKDFDQIVSGGEVLLMLHGPAEGEHGLSQPRGHERLGLGCVVWFSASDIEAAFARAKDLGAEILAEPWVNPRAGWTEFSVRDPDGYTIGVWAFSGE